MWDQKNGSIENSKRSTLRHEEEPASSYKILGPRPKVKDFRLVILGYSLALALPLLTVQIPACLNPKWRRHQPGWSIHETSRSVPSEFRSAVMNCEAE